MKKRTRSILEELNTLGRSNNNLFIENTGTNLIESTINLFNHINEHYGEEVAAELERKFINSIKNNDSNKFKRSMQRIINRNSE